jgi:NAD(P)H-hydrate epimerase
MKNDFQKIFPERNPWCHKGEFGYVLIVGGGRVYSGSPIFNAVSALRSGADLTMIITNRRAADIAANFSPDIIARPLDRDLDIKHTEKIISLSKKFDSLIIGGGLSRDNKTYKAIKELIKKIDLPMVIDAEAIRVVAEDKEILKNKKVILTPHTEEFRILTGEKVASEVEDRKEKVKKWAKKIGAIILLKGNVDVISDGEEVFLNETGSPFMTKGGFGDTLAGICGAMLARKINLIESAKAAAFINGKAGEMAAEIYKEGLIASDIFKFIPKAIEQVKSVKCKV